MAFFNFAGDLSYNGFETKYPFFREGKTSGGADYASVNFTVATAKNNRAQVELFGMKSKTITKYDNDGNKIEIEWEDREDPDVISQVSSLGKHVIAIDEERHEFITDYDAVMFLSRHLDDLKNDVVVVTGATNKNFYNGTASDRFQIRSIYTTNEETKKQLKVTMKFFWSKDSIDTADWADEKKIYINGYTSEFVNKNELGADKGANRYVAQQVVFDCSKVDFDNEKHIALVKYKLKQMGIDYNDGKPKTILKGNKYVCMNIITSYNNGAEEVPFDESTLTENQKEAIKLGLKTLDDFKPAGQTFGNRVTVYKITDFDLRGDYADGYVECDDTAEEFEELIFTPTKQESVDDLEKKSESKKTSAPTDDDVEDLFG